MVTHSDSIHLRYALLLNVIAAMLPSLGLKGRAHDPLLNASWWPFHDQHSAVLVVLAAAVLGTALVYFLVWQSFRRWWCFVLAGAFTGAFPGLFYVAVTTLPEPFTAYLIAMAIAGFFWGAIVGLVIYGVMGKAPPARPNPNQSLERP